MENAHILWMVKPLRILMGKIHNLGHNINGEKKIKVASVGEMILVQKSMGIIELVMKMSVLLIVRVNGARRNYQGNIVVPVLTLQKPFIIRMNYVTIQEYVMMDTNNDGQKQGQQVVVVHAIMKKGTLNTIRVL